MQRYRHHHLDEPASLLSDVARIAPAPHLLLFPVLLPVLLLPGQLLHEAMARQLEGPQPAGSHQHVRKLDLDLQANEDHGG